MVLSWLSLFMFVISHKPLLISKDMFGFTFIIKIPKKAVWCSCMHVSVLFFLLLFF